MVSLDAIKIYMGQGDLAKGDIARWLIMAFGTPHSLSISSIVFARWQYASRSWSWWCIWDLHFRGGDVSDGTIRKSDGGFL